MSDQKFSALMIALVAIAAFTGCTVTEVARYDFSAKRNAAIVEMSRD